MAHHVLGQVCAYGVSNSSCVQWGVWSAYLDWFYYAHGDSIGHAPGSKHLTGRFLSKLGTVRQCK